MLTQAESEPLKIICFEEHFVDPHLQKAATPGTLAVAPYYADLNSRFRDDPSSPGELPALRPVQDALGLAGRAARHRIAAMDECGIDMQVLSYTDLTQVILANGLDVARSANDKLAEQVSQYPNRLAGFCTLPWQQPELAAMELERCITELGLHGCMLAGRPATDDFIDAERFQPVLAAFDHLRVPLYIHPGPPAQPVQSAYYQGFNSDLSARFSLIGWGWHHEAGVQVTRLLLSGAFDRLRNLQVISGHWGEMVPFFLQRMDDVMPREVTGLSRSISQTYREHVYVTPSGMLAKPHLVFLREVLGVDRILFSIDYPYLTMRGARAWLEELPIPPEERAAISHRNGEYLLSLAKTH